MLACQRLSMIRWLLYLWLLSVPVCQSSLAELNGRLIQCSRAIYLVTTNTTPPVKRPIADMDVFTSWGLDASEVKRVSCEEIQQYQLGDDLPSRPVPAVLVNETEVRENMEILRHKLNQVVGVYKDPQRAKQAIARAVEAGEGADAISASNSSSSSGSGSVFGSKVYSRGLTSMERTRDEPLHHPDYADILQKTVIVTGCNRGFVNHLHNFKCFMDRLGFKFLVVSMDLATHEYLTENTDMVSYFYKSKSSESMEEATTFRSRHFNMIVKRKKHAVYDVMKLGYNVLFSDTDVVLTRDPMAHMIWRNMDYTFSINHICPHDDQFNFLGCRPQKCLEGNTGFYFVRSNERTIKTWEHSFDAMEKNGKLDDQAIFWTVLRQATDPTVHFFRNCSDLSPNDFSINNKLTICPLNLCMFNSGMLRGFWDGTYSDLVLNLARRNEVMYALHANYLSGNEKKAKALDKYGLWLATESSKGMWNGKCKDLTPENASYICDLKPVEGIPENQNRQQCAQSL